MRKVCILLVAFCFIFCNKNPADTDPVVVIKPEITVHPQSDTVNHGQTATFGVIATGNKPFTYTWMKNGADISGATDSSYTTPATVMSDSGSTFRCIVSNSSGNAISNPATLIVNPIKPEITVHPQADTVNEGHTATFSVVATGSRPFNYQWQRDSVDIAWAKDPSYTIPAAAMSDNEIAFRCIVSNRVGSDTSTEALLSIVIAYNISGTVKNTGGIVISGAHVKLEKAGLETTTGTDGSFIIASLYRTVINDVIAVTKDGYLNYRMKIKNSDTGEIEIKMIECAGILTDIEGNEYQTVRIGNQVWMVENLRVTKYNDGTAISHVPTNFEWGNLETPGYCYYENTTDVDKIKKWGALYNWYTVSPRNPKNIAPPGWRVPTEPDMDTLQNYMIANGYNFDGTTTENKIAKSMAAQADWKPSKNTGAIGNNLGANNRSGFSALPGGFRIDGGTFHNQSYHSNWWSATEYASFGCRWYLDYYYTELFRGSGSKTYGFYVRLVRDFH